MDSYLSGKIIRLRCRKNYPEARNHVIIGQVLEENASYIVVKGRSFHFRDLSGSDRSQIRSGETMVRIVPWSNIEIIHWVSNRTDWKSDFIFDRQGNLILNDLAKTMISTGNGLQE